MNIIKDQYLLRIYVDEDDKFNKIPVYEAILDLACKEKIAGATVMKGFAGYGALGKIHTSKILILSEQLPVIIDILDSKENIDRLLELLKPILKKGTVMLQKVDQISVN